MLGVCGGLEMLRGDAGELYLIIETKYMSEWDRLWVRI